MLEAMACGATVLASDIPSLREAAGFRDVGDLEGWIAGAIETLTERPDRRAVRRATGLAKAARCGWPAHVETLSKIYQDVLSGGKLGKL